MMTRRDAVRLVSAAAIAPLASKAAEPDWPQWRGPSRDGLSTETGLLKQWPSSGPKELWRVQGAGAGYGSFCIAGSQFFVQGSDSKASSVHCYNRADGKKLWSVVIGRMGSNDRGDGARSTPTFDNGRLYVMTETGDLACLEANGGKRLWQKNILAEFGGSNPNWLLSESPLIDGNRLIVTPGGRGAGMVALDKNTGAALWKTADLSDPAGYSSAVAADVGGVRCYMNFTSKAGVGVRASDGKLLWSYANPANRVANCTTPVFSGNKVYYTSAYGTGCGLLNLTAADGAVKTNEVYFNRDMMNHHGGVVLVNGYVYGFSNAILTCMKFDTGEVAWRDRSVGKGALTYADGHLFLLGENCTAGLAEASPQGYKEKGRFSIPDHSLPSWAHPVVCGGKLYIRNQAEIQCFDVKA